MASIFLFLFLLFFSKYIFFKKKSINFQPSFFMYVSVCFPFTFALREPCPLPLSLGWLSIHLPLSLRSLYSKTRKWPLVFYERNVKIGLKRVAVRAFGTSPIPKCTVFRAWFVHYRLILPGPQIWRVMKVKTFRFFLNFCPALRSGQTKYWGFVFHVFSYSTAFFYQKSYFKGLTALRGLTAQRGGAGGQGSPAER